MSYKTYTYTPTTPNPIQTHWNLAEYKEYRFRVESMYQWCDENLENWGCTPTDNGFHEFWFANQEDYVMFVLRWS
jgi:hypothetical protein